MAEETGAQVEPRLTAEVSAQDGYAANRANWDGRARVHLGSRGYDVAGLLADPHRISGVVRRDLELWRPHLPRENATGVDGLSLVHLQCHIGTDTLSLSRLGARCTGVDLSPVSLEIAADLARRAGQQIRYVEANVVEAAGAVGEQADLVYTSTGTICWVQDLTAWAEQVATLLRPGGSFFFRDSHPMIDAMADGAAGELVPGYRYFPMPEGRARTYADGVTYTDGDQSLITQARTCEWPHSVAEVLGALLAAGLEIRDVDEQDDLPWPAVAWSVVARRPR